MLRELKTVQKLAAEGTFSEPTLRWFIAKASDNGLAEHKAIVRIGRRVYFDVAAFDRWIGAQQQAAG